MFKNIIFDWSGVIKDSLEDHLFIVNYMFRELGGKQISLEELRQNWVQPYMLFYNRYLPTLTLEQEQAAYRKAIEKAPSAKAFPGMVGVIKQFKQHGIKMVVLSSDLSDTLAHEIEIFGLQSMFLNVVTNVHDKSEVLGKLIRACSFNPDETIFIGDTNHEIEAGKKWGVWTGAVTWGYATVESLTALKPDFIFNSASELKKTVL